MSLLGKHTVEIPKILCTHYYWFDEKEEEQFDSSDIPLLFESKLNLTNFWVNLAKRTRLKTFYHLEKTNSWFRFYSDDFDSFSLVRSACLLNTWAYFFDNSCWYNSTSNECSDRQKDGYIHHIEYLIFYGKSLSLDPRITAEGKVKDSVAFYCLTNEVPWS